eukprot:TRINITY_DN13806_c0_g1_i2.p1 TRINITY_DN13806_c0_g1~~TRINITY_DN13806_c0_g1_i2.p1  ORF type:complete len:269 (-),score=52.74 TRINITY_DN13806_c0_g1_i2:169-975(-)
MEPVSRLAVLSRCRVTYSSAHSVVLLSRSTINCRHRAFSVSPVTIPSLVPRIPLKLNALFCLATIPPSSRTFTTVCRSSSDSSDAVRKSREIQVEGTALLAELLKCDPENLQEKLVQNVESLTEQFFVVTSTYLEMAKKEGNSDVVQQLERVLRAAMEEKEKTLRPEIRLLNQLLRQSRTTERVVTINMNLPFLCPDSYFFQLLGRMIVDVQGQKNPSEKQQNLLVLLKTIERETREVSRALPTANTSSSTSTASSSRPKKLGFGSKS